MRPIEFFLLILILASNAAAVPSDVRDKQKRIKIYMAAGLFNGAQTRFNSDLARRLEKNYEIVLPQRDGFEFGSLTAALEGKLPAQDVRPAVDDIIYSLDMGRFIPSSDVVVANLDEPIDEGLAVEITHARLLGKPVIGFRTDIRSPYGSALDALGGIHTFVAYQCRYFIRHYMPGKNDGELDALAEKISAAVQKTRASRPDSRPIGGAPSDVVDTADFLFNGIDDIHSKAGLGEVVRRFSDDWGRLKKIRPEIFR